MGFVFGHSLLIVLTILSYNIKRNILTVIGCKVAESWLRSAGLFCDLSICQTIRYKFKWVLASTSVFKE